MDMKIVHRIRKLLALSKSANEHEAQLAAQKASEMMEQYQIAMSQVEVDDMRNEKIDTEQYTVADLKMKYIWVATLAYGCAKLFDGTVLMSRRLHGTSFTFVGYPGDIAAMKAMFEHLWESWKSIVEADLAEAKAQREFNYGTKYTPSDTMKFKQGHGVAYASRIYQRALALAKARKQNVAAASTTGTALMVIKDQALATWMKDNHVGQSTARQATGSSDGRVYGARAGDNAALGGAVTGGHRRIGAA